MGLVKANHPVEVVPQPTQDLVQPPRAALTNRAQRGIGGKENALGQSDLLIRLPATDRVDVALPAADIGPVPNRILDQLSNQSRVYQVNVD